MVRLFTVLAILGIGSCAAEPLPSETTISIGTFDRGYLRNARSLPNRGEGYVRLRPEDDARYGTRTLLRAIERASREVSRAFPGGSPLAVGDLSSPHGGAHARHRSHRSGRDADLLFFARDAGGIATRNTGWMRFDPLGLAAPGGRIAAFDDARNWHLVRTLLMDDDARVKWIFCSNALKARLLRHAARHEPSPEAILRATWVLHEPSAARPHDDHFHLRVGCAPEERSLGCRERAPHWPWVTDAASKEDTDPGSRADDARLLGWLLAEEHLDEPGHVGGARLRIAPKPSVAVAR